MKKREILSLYRLLKTINYRGVKFNYGIARNIQILEPYYTSMMFSIKRNEEYERFESKRIELNEKFAQKDGEDNAILKNNQYQIADKKGFDTAMNALEKKYKVTIDEQHKKEREFNKTLDDEEVVELFKIDLGDFPVEIKTQEMSKLIILVKDDNEAI